MCTNSPPSNENRAFLVSAPSSNPISDSGRTTTGRPSRKPHQVKGGAVKVSGAALRGLIALTVLAAITSSCTEEVWTPGDAALVRLAFQSVPSAIDDGANTQISVFGVEANGRQVSLSPGNFSTVWSSSDTDVLRVTSSGSTATVEAVFPGEAIITVYSTPLNAAARASSAGNLRVSTSISANRVPAELVLLSPNHVSGLVNTPLPDSVLIRALDRRGDAVPGVQVRFEVLEGGGGVSPATVIADTGGYARTSWRLGPNAGRNRMRGSTNSPTRHVYVEAVGTTPEPARINVVAGDGQQGTVASNLPTPLSVRVTDSQSRPVPGVPVAWSVLSGGGTIAPQVALTDAEGISAVSWTLGTVAGTQTARAAVGTLTASFTASARAGAPSRLVKLAGDGQSAAVNTRLTDSLSVQVHDQYGNAVSGVTVNWSVLSGGGSLSPAASTTGSGGITRAAWTMGAAAGAGTASASVTGVPGVAFSATATDGSPLPPPPAPVSTVTVTPSPATVAVGNSLQFTATLRDASGNVLTGRTVTWSTSNTSIATVSAAGLVTALAAGQVTVTATSEQKTGTSSVTVTAPSPPPQGVPAPRAGDLVVFDTRAGGAQSIQAVNTFAAAMAFFTEWRSQNTFTTNMDGSGTKAIRHQYSAASGCTQQEQSAWVRKWVYPQPVGGVLTKQVYYQFKYRMGRHPSDTGTTFGEVNRFQITNDPCNSANGTNYGMKLATFQRMHPTDGLGSLGRTDIIFGGPAPTVFSVRCDGCSFAYYSNWRPQDHIGENITVTLYLKAESGAGTNDGIVRAWVNGSLIIERTNANLKSRYFSGPEIMSVINTPQLNQMVYTWDHLIWIPN
jgi:Big-like domain-containing protein